jgi:hypothetical protein
MDEGFNTFINGISTAEFNNGEYQSRKRDPHQIGYMFGPQSESIYNAPDAIKERNIGNLLYFKPGYAMELLRNHILGEDRFDYAFKKYIRDWAYKHPTPWDFFRSMENSAGEDLAWFWKGMILNNYALDQAIKRVEYVNGDPREGALISIANAEQMAMPVIVEYTTVSGKTGRKTLPVEIWQNNDTWTFKVDTQEALKKVVIDPDHVFPDVDDSNNTWMK